MHAKFVNAKNFLATQVFSTLVLWKSLRQNVQMRLF